MPTLTLRTLAFSAPSVYAFRVFLTTNSLYTPILVRLMEPHCSLCRSNRIFITKINLSLQYWHPKPTLHCTFIMQLFPKIWQENQFFFPRKAAALITRLKCRPDVAFQTLNSVQMLSHSPLLHTLNSTLLIALHSSLDSPFTLLSAFTYKDERALPWNLQSRKRLRFRL
jgi:hypothetical protein